MFSVCFQLFLWFLVSVGFLALTVFDVSVFPVSCLLDLWVSVCSVSCRLGGGAFVAFGVFVVSRASCLGLLFYAFLF